MAMGMDTNNNDKPLGMKWYKFLIYFLLFAGALLNLLYGVGYLTGKIYEVTVDGVTREMVYWYWGDELHILDIIYGILLIAVAVFAIIVRNKLARFETNALKYLDTLYIAATVIGALYAIALVTVISYEISSTEILQVISPIITFGINKDYFAKRKHWFTGKPPVVSQGQVYMPYQNRNETSVVSQNSVQYGENKSQSLTPTAKTMVTPKTTHASENKCVFCMECGNAQEPGTEVCAICGAKIE